MAGRCARSGSTEEAKKTFAEAHAKKVDYHVMHRNLLAIALAEGDRAAVQRELEWAKGKTAEPGFQVLALLVELAQGRRVKGSDMPALASFYAAGGDCESATRVAGAPRDSEESSRYRRCRRPVRECVCRVGLG